MKHSSTLQSGVWSPESAVGSFGPFQSFLFGGFLAGTVAIRLHDLEGHPIGYAGRVLDPDRVRQEGKWRWPPGYPKGSLLFNWHRAVPHRSDGLILVESPWLVMTLTQAGFPRVVAIGETAVTPRQIATLAGAARVVLMLDGDDAGERATRRHRGQPIH